MKIQKKVWRIWRNNNDIHTTANLRFAPLLADGSAIGI